MISDETVDESPPEHQLLMEDAVELSKYEEPDCFTQEERDDLEPESMDPAEAPAAQP